MDQQKINTERPASARLLSLDALRGFDMFWIISGEGIFHGLANVVLTKHNLYRDPNNWQITATGDLNFLEQIAIGISNQLHHSPWNGCTFYDIIFPLFIFIAGISMVFSFGNQFEKATPRPGSYLQEPTQNVLIHAQTVKKNIYRSLIKRTLILILMGMVVNGLFKWQGYENTRIASVLGRIALSCFFAAIIYLNCNLRSQLVWFAVILLGYWAAMMLIPVPGYGAGVLTPGGNLEGYVDRLLLPGKLHRAVYDPEGLLSTIPAIATAMLGIFTGQFLRNSRLTSSKKVLWLFAAAAGLLLLGLLWGIVFPINKNMWTSSFVLYAGGWAVLLFALFYYVIDIAGFKKWCMPLVWIGCNAILIYIAAHGLVHFESTAAFLFGGLYDKAPAPWHDALLWTGVALIQFAALYFLYKRKWFLKV
jgi:predicted acyltransferase